MEFNKIVGFPYYIATKTKKFSRYFAKKKSAEYGCTESHEMMVIKKAEEYNQNLNSTSDAANWINFVEFQVITY